MTKELLRRDITQFGEKSPTTRASLNFSEKDKKKLDHAGHLCREKCRSHMIRGAKNDG